MTFFFSAVSTFCNENEALSAVSSKPDSFHVAIVEVMVFILPIGTENIRTT